MYETIKDIANFPEWKYIEKVNKGWSDDTKYYIEHKDGRKLLLRIADVTQCEKKKKEFHRMEQFANLGFCMSLPLEIGLCNGGKCVYTLLSWIEGEDLETALPTLSEDNQYRLGVKAGRILKKMHSLPVPPEELPKETRIPKKKKQMQDSRRLGSSGVF